MSDTTNPKTMAEKLAEPLYWGAFMILFFFLGAVTAAASISMALREQQNAEAGIAYALLSVLCALIAAYARHIFVKLYNEQRAAEQTPKER